MPRLSYKRFIVKPPSKLVIVGDTQPNTFETIGYTTGISWMPFTHEESSYVVIEAELDGTIREIR